MDIKMVCVVCRAEIEIKDLPELELDEDRDIENLDIDCPECGKRYWLGG